MDDRIEKLIDDLNGVHSNLGLAVREMADSGQTYDEIMDRLDRCLNAAKKLREADKA